MLTIQTSQVPASKCVGSYGPNDSKARPKLKHDQLKAEGSMPWRALFLHPFAAASYIEELHPAGVAVSDMYRSAESSLNAVATGRGALPPGFSLHNFGEAIDLRVADTMKRMRDLGIPIKTKRDLDLWMQERGWYCHRTDHAMEHESWHYNAFLLYPALGFTPSLPVINPKKYDSTSGWAEELVKKMYRDQLYPNDLEVQTLLKKLGMYSGALDGDLGPQSKSAIAAFQRAWGMGKDGDEVTYTLVQGGKLDDRTRRTVAFLASEKAVVPVPALYKLAA